MNSKTANFRVLQEDDGIRYQFFCALSGAHVCTTRPIQADTSEQALHLAWESEGRHHFNQCSKCGNWVIDAMYNVDVLACVDCAPFEEAPTPDGRQASTEKGQGDRSEGSKNLQLERFGFGPNVMKKTKVCTSCGHITKARSFLCPRCGGRLPFATLFDSYQRRHRRKSAVTTGAR